MPSPERLLIPAAELEIGMIVDEPDWKGTVAREPLTKWGEWVEIFLDDGSKRSFRPYRRIHVKQESYEF